MIPENVKKVLTENLWYVATCGSKPNVVPVGFKCVCDDGKLAIAAILLKATLENIKTNGKIAVACANPLTGEAYQINGTAQLVNEGEAYEHYAKLVEDTFKGAMQINCMVIITPEKLINASPNEHNKEEIEL